MPETIKDGILRLESDVLKSKDGVCHGFLGRTGGVSEAPFKSLNFDFRGVGADAPENVMANMKLASKACSAPLEAVVLLNQAHGSAVVEANQENRSRLRTTDADAIVCETDGIPLGILAADCLPVLLYDPVKRVIGAAHAGWKGTAAGISVRTVEAMRSMYGSDPKDIIAAFGPAIGQCCYTVGHTVIAAFKFAYSESAWGDGCFNNDAGKMTLDLAVANAGQLIEAGLIPDNIDAASPCTACNSHQFFSYRQDRGATGRQLSFIMLTGKRVYPCS